MTMVTILMLLAFPKQAQAYLDPGAGSYLIQIIVGGVLGAILIIKTYGRVFFYKMTGKKIKKVGTDEKDIKTEKD
jgi:hypothetical protein